MIPKGFFTLIMCFLISYIIVGQDIPEKYQDIANQLDSIHSNDQNIRLAQNSIAEQFGWDSEEIQESWKKIAILDSINMVQVEQIIDQFGWLGPDQIGKKGNTTLFLVIQHAPVEKQEKYLPVMRDAVTHGKASPADLALLEDRILMYNKEFQIYGSQLITLSEVGTIFYPIKDVDNVNARREKVGLDPIEEYAKIFNIEWSLESYYENLEKARSTVDKHGYVFPEE